MLTDSEANATSTSKQCGHFESKTVVRNAWLTNINSLVLYTMPWHPKFVPYLQCRAGSLMSGWARVNQGVTHVP